MKVLFGTDLFYQNVAGSTNFIRQLTLGLTKKGHKVFVIAPSKSFKNTVSTEKGITIYGIRSIVIPEAIYSSFRIPITAGPNRIRRILEEIKPDVINIQDHFMIGAKIAKEARKLNIPVVGTNHFMPENFIHYLYPPRFGRKVVKKLAWTTFLRVYKHLNLITTPTQTASNMIKDLGLKNPIIPVSNGVNLKIFNPKNNGLYLKKRFKINSEEQIILCVGRLDVEKHVDILIKAMPLIIPHVNAKLIVAGKGTEKSKLTNLAKRLGVENNVLFTGFIPNEDLPYLYRIADLFAIASIAELQSIATLEALASGLPVVGANVIALPELIKHGKNGYLFNEGDIQSLAKSIVSIFKDSKLKKKFSLNSLKIVKNHNIENTINTYEKIYKKISNLKS